MSLEILVTVTVNTGDEGAMNSAQFGAAIAEGTTADIRRLANEAASRAEAAIGRLEPRNEQH